MYTLTSRTLQYMYTLVSQAPQKFSLVHKTTATSVPHVLYQQIGRLSCQAWMTAHLSAKYEPSCLTQHNWSFTTGGQLGKPETPSPEPTPSHPTPHSLSITPLAAWFRLRTASKYSLLHRGTDRWWVERGHSSQAHWRKLSALSHNLSAFSAVTLSRFLPFSLDAAISPLPTATNHTLITHSSHHDYSPK